MARRRGDTRTPDLLSWEPPVAEEDLVVRYDEPKVRAASLRDRIARAVAETLRDYQDSRESIAQAMSEWLGEDVSKPMLDAYASQAREGHTISYLRLLALIHVTGDTRLLQLGAELFQCAVIDDRYLPWVEVGQAADVRDESQKWFDAARQRARRGVRR